jgi:GT2 family glycosyltransferase
MARDEEIEGLKRRIAELEEELAAAHASLAGKNAQLQRILDTTGWRLLQRYGRFKYGVLKPLLGKSLLYRYGRLKHNVVFPMLERAGMRQRDAVPSGGEITYDQWVSICEAVRYDPARAGRRIARLSQLSRRPLVSVVTPVYNTAEEILDATIRSVRAQLYPDWELCLHDDASTLPHVRAVLERHAAEDSRVRVSFGTKNSGISAASNAALAVARGEYVALLDHDDIITPDALLEMVETIEATGAELLYSDEDKLDPRGRRTDPFFKPDWSPDFLLSINYCCHLTVAKRELVEAVGGFREGFEGSQDYDLWLRLSERTEKIAHVPMVLYHWRQVPGSTAVDASNKNFAHERSRRAIGEALERRGGRGRVEDGPVPTSFRVVRALDREPLVTVIIPTRDRVDLLAQAIEGIERKTDYRNVEILVVDNGSSDPATLDYLRATPHRVLRDDGPFNFSRLNNRAAHEARGELLLLLNNDTEPLRDDWLRSMVEHALRPEVGIVGAKLLYPSGKVQHAGVVLGIGSVAGHSHKHFPGDAGGYYHAADLIRNFSAVTAACMLVRSDVFKDLGGLDEVNLAVAFNDVDFCLRARERGYLVVWTPEALLTHFESESRGFDLNPREIDYMLRRWSETLIRDPYYSPNLTLVHEDFAFDLSKPDGYCVGVGQEPSDSPPVELTGERMLSGVFRSTHDGLAGVAFDLEQPAPADLTLRLSIRPADGAGAQIAAEVSLGIARLGQLFVLFDAPIAASRGAFSFTLEAPGAVRGRAPVFRTSAPGVPSFRLLHR